MWFGTQTTDKFKYSAYGYEADDPSDWWTIDSKTSGREFQYEGLFGGAFPVGAGRMGVFLQYTGNNGELRGDQVYNDDTNIYTYPYDQKNKLDNLALRVLYGIPVNSNLKLGAELQVAYKKEKNKTVISNPYSYYSYINASYGWGEGLYSLLHLAVPYDSKYYEASMKASAEAMIGPAKLSITARGGMPFSSENNYYHGRLNSGVNYGGVDINGKVEGYNAGFDAWARVPLNGTISLPFLLGFDYKKLERNGDGLEYGFWGAYGGWSSKYKIEEKSMNITAGGGIDYTPVKDTKIAGGLYYSYLMGKTIYEFQEKYYTNPYWPSYYHDGYPETKEHRLTLKLAVEKALCPDFTLTGGFNAFYGRVKQTYDYEYFYPGSYTNPYSASLKGKRWGANASIGASFKAGATMMEPYVAGGFERVNLSGDGTYYSGGVLEDVYPDSDLNKKTWFIGAGLALRF